MKKLLLIFFLLTTHLVSAQPRYVTTIPPFREIIKAVVGDRGEVHSLLPPGASPHTYELRPSDVLKIEKAPAFFLGGKNLDDWALKLKNRHRIELLGLVPQDLLLYVKEHHDESHIHEDDHHHGSGVDPHFWTDPLTVKGLLPALTDSLCAIDPGGSDIYHKNSILFAQQLEDLYQKINEMLAPVRGKAVVLSHPFFQYYLHRFGIPMVDAVEIFPGREPSPKEIKQIIQQVKRKQVQAIFTHPQLADRPAKIIAEASGLKIYELDPLGGTVGRQSYEELLLYNTHKLVESLR